MSSPLISPSEIGVSPCLPDTVPVSLFPSALKLKVCWRVWPSLPGRSAIHLPFIPPLEHDSANSAINAHAKREPVERLVERLNIRFLRLLFILYYGQAVFAVTLQAGPAVRRINNNGHRPGAAGRLLALTDAPRFDSSIVHFELLSQVLPHDHRSR